MEKLYTARDSMEAHFLRQFLEQQGIVAQVLGENLGSARGELPLTGETLPSVWVRHEDVELAVALAKDFEAQGQINATDEAAEPWICPGCGELVEGQFAVCWNCQTTRPGDELLE